MIKKKVGFRKWFPKIDQNGKPYLESLVTTYRWDDVIANNDNPCLTDFKEGVTYSTNEVANLGFFSYKSLSDVFVDDLEDWFGGYVIGAVEHFNHVITHEYGFRSQSVKILGFYRESFCSVNECSNFAQYYTYEVSEDWNRKYRLLLCEEHKDECGDYSDHHLIPHSEYMKSLSTRYGVELMPKWKLKELAK